MIEATTPPEPDHTHQDYDRTVRLLDGDVNVSGGAPTSAPPLPGPRAIDGDPFLSSRPVAPPDIPTPSAAVIWYAAVRAKQPWLGVNLDRTKK
jgi:hypothetical protein